MIADAPVSVTHVGDEPSSSAGRTNFSRTTKATASPSSARSPRSRATAPTTSTNAMASTIIGVVRA